MKSRDKVYDRLEFRANNNSGRKESLSWEEITTTKGILQTDYLKAFEWRTEDVIRFGYEPEEGETNTFMVVIVERERVESDDEYFKRMKYEADIKAKRDEKEKLEYLRLKAKYEPVTDKEG